VALTLLNEGFQNVHVLKGGWRRWVDAGYPTEKK